MDGTRWRRKSLCAYKRCCKWCPLQSPVSPSLSLPCVISCHHRSTELYRSLRAKRLSIRNIVHLQPAWRIICLTPLLKRLPLAKLLVGGERVKIVEAVTFYVILRNSELITIYRKYNEILRSHRGGVEGQIHLGRDAVTSSIVFPRKWQCYHPSKSRIPPA